jgi:HEAT repeat protein
MQRNQPITWHAIRPKPGESPSVIASRLLEAFPFQDEAGQRHIIVAFGRLGDPRVIPFLNRLLDRTNGFMLGDVIQTLTKLGVADALPSILKHEHHEIEWVRNSVKRARRELGTKQGGSRSRT